MSHDSEAFGGPGSNMDLESSIGHSSSPARSPTSRAGGDPGTQGVQDAKDEAGSFSSSKGPDDLAIESESETEEEVEEVKPLRRIFSRKLSVSGRARTSSFSSIRRDYEQTGRRSSAARVAAGASPVKEASESESGDGAAAESEALPQAGRTSTTTRTQSQSAIIERYLTEIEEDEEDRDHSFWRSFYHAFFHAAKAVLQPDFIRYDFESLKIIFRTWACGWVGLLLMVILPVERWIGGASLLMPLVGLLSSPGGLSVTNAVVSVLLEAAFAAWGLLCAYVSDVIQWAIRGFPTQAEVMASLVAEGTCAAGDLKCLDLVVLSGRYLRIDVTIVTIFRTVVTLWVIGIFEQYKPKLFRIPFVITLIVVIPIIPSLNATPWLSFWSNYRSMVISLYFGFSLKLLTCLLIFPITSNKKYVNVLVSVTRSVKDEAHSFFDKMFTEKPSSDTFKDTFETIAANCSKLSSTFFKHDIDGILMKLEVSYSRLDSGDIGEFRSRLREVIYSLNSIHFFLINIQNRKELLLDIIREGVKRNEAREDVSIQGPRFHVKSQFSEFSAKKYKPAGRFEFRRGKIWQLRERETLGELKLEKLDEFYALIIEHYRPSLEAATDVIDEVGNWLYEANKTRLWMFIPQYRARRERRGKSCSESLLASLIALEACHAELVKSFNQYRTKMENMVEKDTGPYLFILAQDSFMNLVASEFLNRVHRLARYCSHLDGVQPRPRWLYPFSKTRAKTLGIAFFSLGSQGAEDVEITGFVPVNQVEKRDPDVTLPQSHFQQNALNFEKIVKWFMSPTILFSTKRSFAVLVPLTIFFVRQTLAFGMSCHAVWVSIILVLTMARQAVDGAYGFIARMYATFWGCILGMLIWYISSGSGNGNSYGMAVTCAFAFIIIAMHRHFNQELTPMGSIVFCITALLIPGNSWATTYAPQVGINLGHGWRVCWLRFVTVVIGILLGFFFTMFPYPSTGKKAIRESLGDNQRQLGETTSYIVNFALQRVDNPSVRVKRRSDPIRGTFKQMSNRLLAASRIAMMMKFEPTLTGLWPSKRYKFLMAMQQEIVSVLSLILVIFNKVEDPDNLAKLLHDIGFVDLEQLSSTYAVFSMTANALLAKTALPSITPGGLSFRHWRGVSSGSELGHGGTVAGKASELYTSYDGRLRLASLVSSDLLYDCIDATMLIVKGLVGESFDTDDKIYGFNQPVSDY